MADKACTIRIKKFLANRLLSRRQMVLEVIHQGRAGVPKKEIQQKLAGMYKSEDANQVIVYGMKTKFGGGRSSALALIYDNLAFAKKFEPKYRLVRAGVATRAQSTRKQRKERKNRMKKVRGVKKAKSGDAKKKK
jgi:small subunit ribosomal protein S24e